VKTFLEIPNTFKILWSDEEQYFGEITFLIAENGNVKINSEHMGKDFVKKVLCQLIDDAKLVE
jgi:hypothetical protein